MKKSLEQDEAKRLREPPKPAARMPNPAEELLREWPKPQAHDVEWVRAWAGRDWWR